MRLGNPAGLKLTVDGKNPPPPGTDEPITLSLGLHGKVSQLTVGKPGLGPR